VRVAEHRAAGSATDLVCAVCGRSAGDHIGKVGVLRVTGLAEGMPALLECGDAPAPEEAEDLHA